MRKYINLDPQNAKRVDIFFGVAIRTVTYFVLFARQSRDVIILFYLKKNFFLKI